MKMLVIVLDLSDCSLCDHDAIDLVMIVQTLLRVSPMYVSFVSLSQPHTSETHVKEPCPRLQSLKLWLTDNIITERGAIALLHRLDVGMEKMREAYIDISHNRVGVRGLLTAQQFKMRHPFAEVVYLPRAMDIFSLIQCNQRIPVSLPDYAISGVRKIFNNASVANDKWHNHGWVDLPDRSEAHIRDLLRIERRSFMRSSYEDIVVDTEACSVCMNTRSGLCHGKEDRVLRG
jgi:hypothetical protein